MIISIASNVAFGDNKMKMIGKIQQNFADDVMGSTQIKEWYKQDGHTPVVNEHVTVGL